MNVKQVYNFVNAATKEAIGETAVLNEDLSNVVEIGQAVFNVSANKAYIDALINHIGRVICVDRKLTSSAPNIMVDGWEYGSVLEKLSARMPEATENETWELTDGASYDPNVFYKPFVTAKFYNNKITFEIPLSITDKQLKQSFSNATQLSAFVAMLYNEVDKSMTIKTDELVMRVINTMIAETIYAEYPSGSGYNAGTGVRAVNLLYKYTQATGDTTVTTTNYMYSDAFIRFASREMALTADRMRKANKLFNVGGEVRFTPTDMLKTVLLSEFEASARYYLYDAKNQFNTDNIKLPAAETVPCWQGVGTSFALADTSKIDVKTPANHTVSLANIVGCMFDRDACMIANIDRRTTSNYNGKAEFFNYWFKADEGLYCDLNEQFVVFFVA